MTTITTLIAAHAPELHQIVTALLAATITLAAYVYDEVHPLTATAR